MNKEIMNLWKTVPGEYEEQPKITAYVPDEKKSDCAVVILPGGAYIMRAPHEGEGYAKYFFENGITAFVVDYRVAPHKFPLPLLDARRGVKFARYYAEKYGINKNKVAIMGSSAGGHLAALTSTYYENIECESNDEIDKEDFIPNAQILCYPVIKLLGKGIGHLGSGANLLGDKQAELGEELSPDNIVSKRTPQAFIWHTMADDCVNVINSLDYAKSLRLNNIGAEIHIFPDGHHGLGLADSGENKVLRHVSKWAPLMIDWLKYIGF